ncbi:MAG: DUF421 domain-containing protein [Alicyclobacillus sp.]|nr:DUF421 domain-containing protein [Alicyclobacillus sp.]
MVSLRLMGKREIGQLSVFDFVVSIMLAELTAIPMEDVRRPLWLPLLAMATLVVLQLLVAVLQLKSHRFRHWVEGRPVVLIERGQLRDQALRKSRYTLTDLLMQLREQGLSDVRDVELAVLETSGKLSVVPKPEKRPLTAGDLGVKVGPGGEPVALVVDGQVVQASLQRLGQDEIWLRKQLAQRGYPELKEVFYASLDGNGSWYIDPVDRPSALPAGGAARKASAAPLARATGQVRAVSERLSHGEGDHAHEFGEPGTNPRDAGQSLRREHTEGAAQPEVEQEASGQGSQQRSSTEV